MASMLSKVLIFFVLVWIGIYVLAYYWIMAPTNNNASTAIINPGLISNPAIISADKNMNTRLLRNSVSLTNPFLSATCKSRIDGHRKSSAPTKNTAVVLVTRNEEHPDDVVSSISSIILNSGDSLSTIVLVDDLSSPAVKDWPQWLQFDANVRQKVSIVRPTTTLGVAGSNQFAANLLKDRNEVTSIVFLDNPAIVSDGWLIPLLDTLQKHPKAIVYPTIDILANHEGFIEADEMVGGFDWALNFIWESMDIQRMPLLPSSMTSKDSPVPSPAAPGILAINKQFYQEIGGFESGLRLWGQHSVELSLRVWLCGGQVIKQPCSRAAQRYKHVFADAHAGPGVTQRIVDMNVMSVAERYMRPAVHGTDYKETVFQARFTGRIPYSVELSQKERFSKNMMHVNSMISDACQSFDWYLKEVYPGLKLDRDQVSAAFQQHVSSHAAYDAAFGPLIQQYLKKHTDIDVNQDEALKLEQRAHIPDERDIQAMHDSFIPKKVPYRQPQDTLDEVERDRIAILQRTVPPTVNPTSSPTFIPISLGLTINTNSHEMHANRVRQELICEDEPEGDSIKSCVARLAEDPDHCSKDKYFMWFGCPKRCGLCGDDGKICFDFYENKCLMWRDQGRCQEEVMSHVCRKACNLCTPALPAPPALPVENVVSTTPPVIVIPSSPVVPVQPLVIDQPLIPPIQQMRPPDQPAAVISSTPPPTEQYDVGIDPYAAQKQYASGSLPDPGDNPAEGPVNCAMNGKANGELLSRVTLHDQDSLIKANAHPYKIFCGIYTYEKNHAGNVQATKETWAKRCDGFIAMSTKLDPNIPSIAIVHEGPEEYDNMWQKSRMIWKYIASKYAENFDFFLLGGDDMFYIIENLRYYLGTDQNITRGVDEGKGLFIGRRFFPPNQPVFNSGGAGYILDRAALKILASHLDASPCFPHQKSFWEDVNVASCLRSTVGIMPMDTRDPLQRERFHPFQPGGQLTYRPPTNGAKDWYVDYNPGLKLGFDCCSTDSISFHYAPAEDLRRLHRYMYHCKDKQMTSNFGIVR